MLPERKSEFAAFALQLTRFAVVGLANTLVAFGAILVGIDVFRFGDVGANLFGYLVGLTVGYVLNRNWTFNSSGPILPTIVRYVAAFAAAYSLNLIVVMILVASEANHIVAQACGIPIYTASFYVLCRWLVFDSARETL